MDDDTTPTAESAAPTEVSQPATLIVTVPPHGIWPEGYTLPEPEPSEDDYLAALSRFQTLTFERARIDRELMELHKRFKEFCNFECLRCGHHWKSYQITEPNQCPRCHSLRWNRPPNPDDRRQRTPEDPARPSWIPRNKTKKNERAVEAKPRDPEADAYWARRERSTIPPPPRFGESNET